MAIQFKSIAKLAEIFTHLNLSLGDLEAYGYTLDCGISELRVYTQDGYPVCSIKPGVLLSSILKLQPLSPKWTEIRNLILSVRDNLPNLVDSALVYSEIPLIEPVCDMQWYHDLKTITPVKNDPGALDGQMGQQVEAQTSTPESQQPPKVTLKTLDVLKVLKMEPVSLRHASLLYQPVKGTSNESRYYVVGIAKSGLRVAIKKPSSHISVRIEPRELVDEGMAKILKHFGLGEKGTHFSGHFQLTHTTATRLVGALLADISADWDTEMPNLSVLENAQ